MPGTIIIAQAGPSAPPCRLTIFMMSFLRDTPILYQHNPFINLHVHLHKEFVTFVTPMVFYMYKINVLNAVAFMMSLLRDVSYLLTALVEMLSHLKSKEKYCTQQ